MRKPRAVLQGPAVEVLNRNTFQIDSVKAANIDGSYPVAFWIGAFPIRVNAARPAEAVLDDVLVERVRADVLVGREHVQLFARHKPQEGSFAGTDRAITCHPSIDLAFHLERNFSAVTTAFILHVSSPLISTRLEAVSQCA
jgi:hypothetical protein